MMATEVHVIIDDQKIRVPQRPSEAPDLGWHLGAEYASALNWEENDFWSIQQWCQDTFDPHTYKMFMRSVWFLRESDALLCRLMWV